MNPLPSTSVPTDDGAARRLTPRRPALPASDPRLSPLLSDLEVRLRPVCGDMAPELFASLVHDMAAVKLRWEQAEREAS